MPNHLVNEKSPYLQQHVHNPVDWYAWGPDAFERARREDKPVFLSIGYSTCHWCHVMEHESFENHAVAEVLNRHFVSIKVDREERPDVDRLYMAFVQAATGSGGWPMSVFLTPELHPFFGGTYFPPDNRYGRPGFKSLLEHVAGVWTTDRAGINQSSANVIAQLRSLAEVKAPGTGALDGSLLDAGFNVFRRGFDAKHGGFGGAPKFPRPSVLNFLLRYYARTSNEEALEMTLTTLRAMADGGMHDQLGGGFHRYSVDERWFVPHFEKMLYDQAQLAISYLEAFQITRDPFFESIARDTLDYVMRDMTHAGGGFYSAEDADSAADPARPREKSEGAFYIWAWEEVVNLLGKPVAEIVAARYGMERAGNVQSDPHGEFGGRNIFYLRGDVDGNATALNEARAKLLAARGTRPRPHLDDKILTAWNGLMISAFAKGAQILGEPRYARAAAGAAEFIISAMHDPTERTLRRRFRDGDAAIPGFLDDYAFFIQALLDLYETDFEIARIEAAIGLAETMCSRFEDRVNGGFYSTAEGDPNLALRMKDDYDGAEPSGNSIAMLALLRLAGIANRDDFQGSAARALHAMSGKLANEAAAVPQMLVALDYSLAGGRQIVLAGGRGEASTQALLKVLRTHFLPNSITLLVDDVSRARLQAFSPAIVGMTEIDGAAAAYVCRDFTCQMPTTDVENFGGLLQ